MNIELTCSESITIEVTVDDLAQIRDEHGEVTVELIRAFAIGLFESGDLSDRSGPSYNVSIDSYELAAMIEAL